LILVQSNFNDAIEGIDMSNLSIYRLNNITQLRLLFRYLFNINQGYLPNTNAIIEDKCTFYSEMIVEKIEELR
jgi:hypothetical protein